MISKAPLHTTCRSPQHPAHASPCHREPTPSRASVPAAGGSRPAPQGTDKEGAG
jgi:hypothetical protein